MAKQRKNDPGFEESVARLEEICGTAHQTLSNPETVQDGTDPDEPDSNEFSLT